MTFKQKLNNSVLKNNSLLCVGLDPVMEKLPDEFKKQTFSFFKFNKYIINQTFDLACAFKPNSAFYEALGADGIEQLKMTCDYINKNYPEIPIILDAKRGDIENTNDGYVKYTFDYLGCDGVTIQPYLGEKAINPFLKKNDKGIIILCKTSNPGSGEFQDIEINGKKLYQHVAKQVIEKWNYNNNCLMVIGATYPEELKEIREIAKNMVFLVPGIGAQGGNLKTTLENGLDDNKKGLIISVSRSIIYAENPREIAKNLKEEINQYR